MEDHTYSYCFEMELNDESESVDMVSDEFYCGITENQTEGGFDELLIQVIKSYPHLYNKKYINFKDLPMKENSWPEIANVMNSSVAECKNRWARLREKFSREKKARQEETRSGVGAPKRPIWSLYENMQFLKPFVVGRRMISNITKKPAIKPIPSTSSATSCQPVSIIDKSLQCDGNLESSTNKGEMKEALGLMEKPLLNNKNETKKSLKNFQCNDNKKFAPNCLGKGIRPLPRKKTTGKETEDSFMQLSTALTSFISNRTEKSSDDIFGELVTSELKKLTESEKKKK